MGGFFTVGGAPFIRSSTVLDSAVRLASQSVKEMILRLYSRVCKLSSCSQNISLFL